ncbi:MULTISPECIES: SPOR domain-containing protein [unclassified Thioalkalivibrio]|uniref:SPOR domain-containing protein n=1 Tax=unclassified Thioalkalivibrio TaxID=2621013 RepID=UPI00036AEC71|nr:MULTISPECIES: SPOR domain-containing protein [unclassified Thioalkalivibrio]
MALSEQCLEQLGLHAPPFDDAPDETFVYSDPLLDGQLESARAALNGPGAVVLMTGENGSGRSLQLMRLLAMLPDPFELIAFRARINTQFESVDNTIRNYLRSQNADDPDRPLTELLADRVADGVDPVIAMDDAHLVGTDIVNNLMRMRSEVLAKHGRAPRIILVGSAGLLRRRLYLPDPSDEDQVTRISLRAFNLEQTAAYLRHRLQAAGLTDPERLLDADAIHHLQTTSQGLPGNLNREANNFLERQCRSERRSGSVATGSTAPGVAAGDAAEGDTDESDTIAGDPQAEEPAFATAFHESDPEPEAEPEPTLRTSRDADDGFTPAAEALSAAPAESETDNGISASAPGGIEADERIPEPPAPESTAFWNQRWFVPAVAITVALGIAAPVAWQLLESDATPADSEIIELPLPEPRVTEAEPEPAPEAEPETLQDDEVAVGDPLDLPPPAETEPTSPETGSPDPAARASETETPVEPEAAAPEPAPEAEPEPAPEPAPAPEPEPEPEPAPEPAAAEPAADDADAERLRSDRAWLSNQDGGATTIQLLAAPNMGAARAYADQHQLGGIRYIPTRVNNRDFVVILAGVFPDRAAAQRAAQDLPAAVRSDEPWIRSIGSVQNAVRD